ncbi:MAG TPA: potassium transporter Kup [Longimicrobiales bacterium]|nr:potassium transporter Kup [Longimicrobiales bacterium]
MTDHSAPSAGPVHGPDDSPAGRRLLLLSLAAVGIVYGDIGTSPIYALRESFHPSHGIEAVAPNVLGVLSLIFWSLVLVISVKYLGFILRADNQGEGGIIALTALVSPPSGEGVTRNHRMLGMVGLFGAALLYGDSMITPAISVLSAIEGLEVVTPAFQPWVIPITIGILVGLFAFQRRGTAGVGAVFGPVTTLWFLVLATLGVTQILQNPSVLRALNPLYAVSFFAENGFQGVLVLGSVFLVVTGGEALYADLGHFGSRPIRAAWFALVLPALVLNYMGQGALVLSDPALIQQPFFSMAPGWGLVPLVILTTAATIIASQAVISGAFSLTRQAVQLGYLPRLTVRQTSERRIGQIYIPAVNAALLVACIGLVVGFRSSSNLAAAYGVAVTTDMVFTTLLFGVVVYARWGWSWLAAAGMVAFFLVIDLGFWVANLHKIPAGGWFPLVVAGGMFVLMTTWKTGRGILKGHFQKHLMPVADFVASIAEDPPVRVPGTAVFMDSNPGGTPRALLHNLKHNKVLHERVVMLNVVTLEVPRAQPADRVSVTPAGGGIFRVQFRFGFSEDPDVHRRLSALTLDGAPLQPAGITYFLGRERLIPTEGPGMSLWRERLFAFMSRNATGATAYFRIPPNQVVEVGMQLEF